MDNKPIEIWKPVIVCSNYMVSNLGRVKSLSRLIWNAHNNSYGHRKEYIMRPNNNNTKKYWRVPLVINGRRRTFSVHRLVAEAFIPNPTNLPQINHIDGNKDNNCVSNLEWCDQSYNFKHAYANGLVSREKQSLHSRLRKLTEDQVTFIKDEYAKAIFTKRGDKMRFCEDMKNRFGLKSRNTIFWIIQDGTNKYINNNH